MRARHSIVEWVVTSYRHASLCKRLKTKKGHLLAEMALSTIVRVSLLVDNLHINLDGTSFLSSTHDINNLD